MEQTSSQGYTNKFRKMMFDKINRLSSTEHEEILKIIKVHGVDFTQNKNGIFFNISALDDEVIEDIDKFVTYSLNNSKELDEYDKKLNECKISQSIDNLVPSRLNDISYYNDVNSIKIKDESKSEWSYLHSIDEKKMANITNFVEKMNQDRDKIFKKKVNVKFYNAQKKFSKRNVSEKKCGDVCEVFLKEAYTI